MYKLYTTLNIHPLPSHRYRLKESYYYTTKEGDEIAVPFGYITNGANIPRSLWAVVPPNDSNILPAVVIHDWLCSKAHKEGYDLETFRYANKIFAEVLETLNINIYKRTYLVTGVKLYQQVRPVIKMIQELKDK